MVKPQSENYLSYLSAYLPVDSSYDSCAYIHAGDKTVLKVLVKDESLQEGCEEHEEGQRVTPPIRSTLLFCEQDQHPIRVKIMNIILEV